MLCERSADEAEWEADMATIAPDELLASQLKISTCTSIFHCLGGAGTDKMTIGIKQLIAFLCSPSNSDAVTRCMIRHIGERLPISLKHPQGAAPAQAQAPGSDAEDGSSSSPASGASGAAGDFFNQATLAFNNGASTKSIKIFNNLTLHVTGCKSPAEARVCATFAWDLIQHVFPYVSSARYVQKIQMLNATCEVGFSFNLRNLQARMRRHVPVTYDPVESQYPGAIAKFPIERAPAGTKPVSIMMFASGNVTISAKSLRHISAAYAFLLNFLKTERASVQSKEPILSKKKLEQTVKRRAYTLKGPRKNARAPSSLVV
jgi:hypothetical protein